MSDYIEDGVRNVRDMHSSAAPSKIDGVCDMLLYIGRVVDEIKLQLTEEQDTLDKVQAELKYVREEIRRRETTSAPNTITTASRDRKGT